MIISMAKYVKESEMEYHGNCVQYHELKIYEGHYGFYTVPNMKTFSELVEPFIPYEEIRG